MQKRWMKAIMVTSALSTPMAAFGGSFFSKGDNAGELQGCTLMGLCRSGPERMGFWGVVDPKKARNNTLSVVMKYKKEGGSYKDHVPKVIPVSHDREGTFSFDAEGLDPNAWYAYKMMWTYGNPENLEGRKLNWSKKGNDSALHVEGLSAGDYDWFAGRVRQNRDGRLYRGAFRTDPNDAAQQATFLTTSCHYPQPSETHNWLHGLVDAADRVVDEVVELHAKLQEDIKEHFGEKNGEIIVDEQGDITHQTILSRLNKIANENIDLFPRAKLLLGDTIYGDYLKKYQHAKKRKDFVNLYIKALSRSGFRELLAVMPLKGVTDDHEAADNFDYIQWLLESRVKEGADVARIFLGMWGDQFNGENDNVARPQTKLYGPTALAGSPAFIFDTRTERWNADYVKRIIESGYDVMPFAKVLLTEGGLEEFEKSNAFGRKKWSDLVLYIRGNRSDAEDASSFLNHIFSDEEWNAFMEFSSQCAQETLRPRLFGLQQRQTFEHFVNDYRSYEGPIHLAVSMPVFPNFAISSSQTTDKMSGYLGDFTWFMTQIHRLKKPVLLQGDVHFHQVAVAGDGQGWNVLSVITSPEYWPMTYRFFDHENVLPVGAPMTALNFKVDAQQVTLSSDPATKLEGLQLEKLAERIRNKDERKQFLEHPGALVLAEGNPVWVTQMTEQRYANGFALVTTSPNEVRTQLWTNDDKEKKGLLLDDVIFYPRTGELLTPDEILQQSMDAPLVRRKTSKN